MIISTSYFERQLVPPPLGWFPAHRISAVSPYGNGVIRRVKALRPDLFCMMKAEGNKYKTLHVHVERFRDYMRGEK